MFPAYDFLWKNSLLILDLRSLGAGGSGSNRRKVVMKHCIIVNALFWIVMFVGGFKVSPFFCGDCGDRSWKFENHRVSC